MAGNTSHTNRLNLKAEVSTYIGEKVKNKLNMGDFIFPPKILNKEPCKKIITKLKTNSFSKLT